MHTLGDKGVGRHRQAMPPPPVPKILSFWPLKRPKNEVEPLLEIEKWLESPPLEKFLATPLLGEGVCNCNSVKAPGLNQPPLSWPPSSSSRSLSGVKGSVVVPSVGTQTWARPLGLLMVLAARERTLVLIRGSE